MSHAYPWLASSAAPWPCRHAVTRILIGLKGRFRLWARGSSARIDGVSATEATAEIFMTAFKALKRKERDAVLQKLVADAELADDLSDTLALEARRVQPRTPLREVLKDLRIRV